MKKSGTTEIMVKVQHNFWYVTQKQLGSWKRRSLNETEFEQNYDSRSEVRKVSLGGSLGSASGRIFRKPLGGSEAGTTGRKWSQCQWKEAEASATGRKLKPAEETGILLGQ